MNTGRWTTLLQFSDGLFPAGAYAHSFGLEWYVQASRVNSAAALEALVRSCLIGSTAPMDAVALCCAHRAARVGDLDTCLRLDATLDAMKPAEELRGASRQMGRQTLRVASSLIDNATLLRYAGMVQEERTSGNHAVALGLVAAALDWETCETIAAYLYCFCAALVNAALRLFPLGQLAGQRVLWNLQPLFGRLAGEMLQKKEEDIRGFAPAMEIAAMRHARLEARLFRS